MNYQKLDAALSAVVEARPQSEEANLSVFIRTVEPPDEDQRSELESLGVYGATPHGRVFSAQLSPHAVSTLSEKPWIRLLTLAQDLKPLA